MKKIENRKLYWCYNNTKRLIRKHWPWIYLFYITINSVYFFGGNDFGHSLKFVIKNKTWLILLKKFILKS